MRKRLLISCGILAVMVVVNCLICVRIVADRAKIDAATGRAGAVSSILPMLDTIGNEIWAAVAMYDPARARMTEENDAGFYQSVKMINEAIESAEAQADTDELRFGLDMIKRSVRSLSKKMDLVRAIKARRQVDMDISGEYFKDRLRVSSAQDTFADQMQTLAERMRTIVIGIRQRVSEYMEIELRELTALNTVTIQERKNLSLLLVISSFIAGLVLLYLVVRSSRLKE